MSLILNRTAIARAAFADLAAGMPLADLKRVFGERFGDAPELVEILTWVEAVWAPVQAIEDEAEVFGPLPGENEPEYLGPLPGEGETDTDGPLPGG